MDRRAQGGHRVQMTSVVLTGAAGPAADAIVAALAADKLVDTLRVLSPRPVILPTDGVHATLDGAVVDLVEGTLVGRFADVDVVVHLGAAVDGTDPHALAEGRLATEAAAVLAEAAAASVGHVVVLSSALVYGALPANAVPLTEASPVHPDHGFRPAVELAEIERAVAEWRGAHPDTEVTVLRCAPVVADGHAGWLAGELHRALAIPAEDRDPESQYLHVDDLASAISTVMRTATGGTRNVAPDGWLTGSERRALETRPRIRVPDSVARRASSARAKLAGSSAPEGVLSYVQHPWVVANDRLRGEGWEPKVGNDEAYVSAFRAAPWSMVSSSRRQELALGAAGAAGLAGIGAVALAMARRRRH